MAYFPNGCAGEVFDDQCAKCIMYERACPIAWVQMEYNYPACNNETARAILDCLVKNNGDCEMFKAMPEVFMTEEARGQMSLFQAASDGVGETGGRE